MDSVLNLIQNSLLKSVHDCSKGGLAVAISEICMTNQVGCSVLLDEIPVDDDKLDTDRILFSESHSRYLLAFDKRHYLRIGEILKENNVSFKQIGRFVGKKIQFTSKSESVVELDVDKTRQSWLTALSDLVLEGKKPD